MIPGVAKGKTINFEILKMTDLCFLGTCAVCNEVNNSHDCKHEDLHPQCDPVSHLYFILLQITKLSTKLQYILKFGLFKLYSCGL